MTMSKPSYIFTMNCKTTQSDLELSAAERKIFASSNDVLCLMNGFDYLALKKYNKGLAFTEKERCILGIRGHLPVAVETVEEQLAKCLANLNRLENNLDKQQYLLRLSQTNEHLFYKLFRLNVAEIMPLVYTPTVGDWCLNFSLLYHGCKGLFVSLEDRGHIYDVLMNWPENDVRIICVTDGERILGLGDLGANGMGIPIGKMMLYTAFAGIKPNHCLPMLLDVGTDKESVRNDPFYIGLRIRRLRGKEYFEFVDEFMQAAIKRFGRTCLIHFEDFGNANAFDLLHLYRKNYCTFNDDIQGTGAIVIAALINALKVINMKITEATILFFGAGEAVMGAAELLLNAFQSKGLSKEEALKFIWMFDSKGLIVKDRPAGGLTKQKIIYAQENVPIDNLLEAVQKIKPSALIGASGVFSAFTPEVLKEMANINKTAIIFALSNPLRCAECTAEQAYKFTNGRCVFASGTAFAPVLYNRKMYYPNNANNAFIYPGLVLGIISAGIITVEKEMFFKAAKKLATLTSIKDLRKGKLFPPLSDILPTAVEIAAEIMNYGYRKGLATLKPEPKDKIKYLKYQLYDVEYTDIIPDLSSVYQ